MKFSEVKLHYFILWNIYFEDFLQIFIWYTHDVCSCGRNCCFKRVIEIMPHMEYLF